jgi:phenylalanyl-tRNA synthetase beta chain
VRTALLVEGHRAALVGLGDADALDAKGDAFAVLAASGAPMQALQIVPGGASWLHPGRSGTIQIGPQNVLGYFGELHPRALEALGADGPLIAFEVILDRIPDAKQKPTRAKPVLELSAFQPVSRDFAFIVDRAVKAGDIVRAAQGVDKKLITSVTVFDVYEGKGIDEAQKSVAIAVTIQPREKTLTDQEIDAVAAKIVAEVTKKTGGKFAGHDAASLLPADVSLNVAIAICSDRVRGGKRARRDFPASAPR